MCCCDWIKTAGGAINSESGRLRILFALIMNLASFQFQTTMEHWFRKSLTRRERRLAITNGTFIEYHPRRYKNVGFIAARTGLVESDESVQLRMFDPIKIGTTCSLRALVSHDTV